jgi:hypothetical protein
MANVTIPYNPNPKKDEFGLWSQKRGRPFLFQINSPNGHPLFNNLLALHTNPASITESMTKSKNVVMTYGGFVEFMWPDELDSVSANHSTGAFLGPDGLVRGSDGLSSPDQSSPDAKKTIAWERYQDLLDLFHNNGNVYDGSGKPVLRGQVLMTYDRGVFQGYFTTFTVSETDEMPFTMNLSWEFKIEKVIYKFPSSSILNKASSTNVPIDKIPRPIAKAQSQTTQTERDVKQATSGGGGNSQTGGGQIAAVETPASKPVSPNGSSTSGGGGGAPGGSPAPSANPRSLASGVITLPNGQVVDSETGQPI